MKYDNESQDEYSFLNNFSDVKYLYLPFAAIYYFFTFFREKTYLFYARIIIACNSC